MAINLERLNKVIEDLKDDLGTALITAGIWNPKDGISIISHNPNPKAAALANEITRNINATLQKAGFPPIDDYYLIKVKNDMIIVIVNAQELMLGIVVDTKKTSMGVLTSVAIPKALEGLIEAQK